MLLLEGAGYLEGEAQGGVVAVLFEGDDGLAGDAGGFGELLLGDALLFSQLGDVGFH